MPIPERKQDQIASKTLPLWVDLFPSAFFIWRTDPKPLKVGIHKDIQAKLPGLGRAYIGVTLQRYTRTRRYLECLIEGSTRVDLDGNPAGFVTAAAAIIAHKEHADLLAYRKARNAGLLTKEPQPTA